MRNSMARLFTVFVFAISALIGSRGADEKTSGITVVKTPPFAGGNRHYVSNRAPLLGSPLVKLPIGSVEPKGWLLGQLRLMRDGFTGRLAEISRFLKDDSGWITLKGKGWEEAPYWLKGYGDLGYILKDQEIISKAKTWLELALKSQGSDGYFGSVDNRENHDLWPNMVMLFALRSRHEATGDARVLPFMTRYFHYENDLPDGELLPGSWQKLRGGDNLEVVYWLYNRTGESFLLDLGRRLHERTSDWTSSVLSDQRDKNWEESSFYHGVNITMGIREPGTYYQQAKDRTLIDAVEANYKQVMEAYGQQPGGMFGADENIRPGYGDPRQGAETCSMVEFMSSFESLLKITGDARYADRCEEIAFNSLPASMTPDLKGLHYLTAPNLISCDSTGEHDFQNGGTLVSYDPWSYRCCQHNVAFGWPYFAEHLWMGTSDDGLAAALYAPSVVTARVGDGAEIRISEDTAYPFGDVIDFTMGTAKPVEFPFYLRIPSWWDGGSVSLNGEALKADPRPGEYLVIRRKWRDGDRLRLEFRPRINVRTWPTLGNSVSVRRGPLWYSLKIGERWRRYGGTDEWPALELLPTTAWNYGLAVDPLDPAATIRIESRKEPIDQPFEPEAAPIVLRARARKIPSWKAEGRMVGKVPPGPVATDAEVEEITLIPMGCARLRISSFPLVKK